MSKFFYRSIYMLCFILKACASGTKLSPISTISLFLVTDFHSPSFKI
eukprot:UN10395